MLRFMERYRASILLLKSLLYSLVREPANINKKIKTSLRIDNEGGMGSYLGIMEDISGSKCKIFAFLIDRLQHRVNGWSA